jgi:hypothetical protein
LVALNDGPPPEGRSKWTRDSLADKMAEIGYKRPSRATVHNILKRTNKSSAYTIFDDKFRAQFISLASGHPPVGAFGWSRDSLPDKMAELGYPLPNITAVSRLLKKANLFIFKTRPFKA